MKNKVHFVKKLCELKGLDHESEEGQSLYSLKIVELLIEIKKFKGDDDPDEPREEESDESKSLAQLLGCS
jgi:hypothetical protein